MRTKHRLLLPRAEISSFNRRHSVALLPLGEVVGFCGGVQPHHECLHGQNALGEEGGLQVGLRDDVLLLQNRPSLTSRVAIPQLCSNQELLSLAEG